MAFNITLISTRHSPIGKCNSFELYKIIESISPEVIFEEIPPSLFDRYYTHKTSYNLESETIIKYLNTKKAINIPADSDDIPEQAFFENYRTMITAVERLTDINGFNFRRLTNINREYVAAHGFGYLNSIQCIKIKIEIDEAIENGLKKLNDERLYLAYKLWKEYENKRENQMLQNIYDFSKDHNNKKAVFTLGSAHRKSIIQKIQEYEKKEPFKLNWVFYS